MLLKSATPRARALQSEPPDGHHRMYLSPIAWGCRRELHRATVVPHTSGGSGLVLNGFCQHPPTHTHTRTLCGPQAKHHPAVPVSACPKQQGTGQGADEMGDGKLTRSGGR